MKKHHLFKCLLTVFVLFATSWVNAQTYCTSAANFAGDSKIDLVQLAGNTVTIDENSAAAGCQTYTDNTSLPAADLSPGGVYTITIAYGTCGFNYGNRSNAWIDFNRDGDFNDPGEMLSPGTGTGVNTFSFNVPCSVNAGTTRMRVKVVEQGGTLTNPCGGYNWGETEDYSISLQAPSGGLNANFFAPDTAFVGTQVTFTNANQTGYISHNWDVDGTLSSGTNATHIFPTVGTYDVKLVSTNCLGSDSLTKSIVIVAPTAPPVANFVSDKNSVELFQTFQMYDLSSNGATFWDWTFIKGSDTVNGDLQPQLRGNNPNIHKNPTVNTGNFLGALSEGVWEACLKSSNSQGAGLTFCKTAYITVVRTSFNMDASTNALPAGIITAASGTIYDNGGPDFDYSAASNLQALIAPCGAQSVTIDFVNWDLGTNATLQLFDGLDASAPSLGTFGSANIPMAPITANSGALYMLWNATGGGGAGFEANWSSVAGTGAAPVAAFDVPSTLYNAVFTDIINTSLNAEGSTTFEWTISGPAGSTTSTSRDLLNQVFTTNGNYTITLKVTSCDGTSDNITKTFVVAPPTSPTELDFTASNQRPELGEAVTFTAMSDKANRWEWSFFPPLNVNPEAPVSDALSERVFTFNSPGTYAVQCRGFNTLDTAASEATVVKTAYIIVVESCTPIVSVTTSSDVGINYFSITDPVSGNTVLENSTASGVDAYTDYADLGAYNLNFGGTYNFEIRRPTNVNPMSRKLWIDWNVDGTFQPNEAVATEATANTLSWTGSFTVPDASTAFEANTKLRIGVSYDTDPNEPCGANSNPAANRIGEFEDYTIRVVNDGDMPTITLLGDDTTYIEQVATQADVNYVTAGATALDPSQGDITPDIVMDTDVDQTLPGIYYEVYTVSDASGNEADPITRVVYVVSDQTAPVITINGSSDTTIEVGSTWTDLPATALDNKEGNLSNAIVTSGMVNADLLGVYTITYSVQDNQGNAASAERIVRVVDTQVPMIDNANADKSGSTWTVEVQLQNIFADVTTATDNYNELGEGLTLKANPASPQGGAAVDTRFPGTTTVVYTATDESGNVTTQEVDYVIRDYIPPVINLRTLDEITHQVGSIYTPVKPSVSDNLYSTSEISLVLTSTDVDGFVVGTYTDVYTATDAAGNVSTATRTVRVVDEVAPKISGKNGGVIRLGVGSSVNAEDYLLFSDNYDDPADLRANHTLVYNNINLQEAGVYSAVFVTEDNSGNVSNEYTLLVDVKYNYEVVTNSVTDLDAAELLSISPNPSAGDVNIYVNLGENETINLAVYNAMGQVVEQVVDGKVTSDVYTVNLANQANGVYFVRMSVKDHIVTKRIVINK